MNVIETAVDPKSKAYREGRIEEGPGRSVR